MIINAKYSAAWLCALVLGMLSAVSVADENSYTGQWTTTGAPLSLDITPESIRFTVNGKTYNNLKPEYFVGRDATQSFLMVRAIENDTAKHAEHRLYLINDASDSSLKGYYDLMPLDAPATDTHGKSLPIHLVKTNQETTL